jgi:sucrose phosphorylase
LREGLLHLLQSIYPDHDTHNLLEEVCSRPSGPAKSLRGRAAGRRAKRCGAKRTATSSPMATAFVNGEHKPLDLLYDFMDTRLSGVATGVHILPYFPYTSDDGFAITDYYAVDSMLGAWEDVGRHRRAFHG